MNKVHCDGTGVEIPADTPTTGLFEKQYADDARKVAEEYLEKLNALHTKAAAQFRSDLEVLRGEYRAKLQSLPDEP